MVKTPHPPAMLGLSEKGAGRGGLVSPPLSNSDSHSSKNFFLLMKKKICCPARFWDLPTTLPCHALSVLLYKGQYTTLHSTQYSSGAIWCHNNMCLSLETSLAILTWPLKSFKELHIWSLVFEMMMWERLGHTKNMSYWLLSVDYCARKIHAY